MSIESEDAIGQPRRRQPALIIMLLALAITGAVVTAVGIVTGIILLIRSDRTSWPQIILPVVLILLIGTLTCGFLLVAAYILRQLRQLLERARSLDERTTFLAEQSVNRQQGAAAAQPKLDAAELKNLLLELRETMLLPPEERTRRYERLVEREFQRWLAAAEQFVRAREFHRGREVLMALAERFGKDERIRQGEEQLERAAEAARANDIMLAARRIEDLMGLAKWEEAERVARELVDKYPVASEPAGLIVRVQRERALYAQRHRQRLHDEIQQFVHHRRWQEAAKAGKLFIETFPSGADTDALRAQIDTLVANADIQQRQELEQRLKDHVRQHQYWEALDLARRIINEHPLSPQANALRGQVARLEELARKQPPPQ